MPRTSLVQTDDVDEARDRLSDIYCPHRLEPGRGGAAPFYCHQQGWGWSELSVFDLQYGGEDVAVDPVPFDDFVLVTQPVHGTFSAIAKGPREGDRARTRGHAVVTDAYGWHQLRWSGDCRVINIVFAREELERVAAELLGHDTPQPVRFLLGPPRPGAPAARWNKVARMLHTELRGSGSSATEVADPLGDSALLRGALLRLGVAALLDAYPHSVVEAGEVRGHLTAPAAVRRATAFVELNADRDIGLADIAAAARLSVRGLQAAYQREDLPSPMRQLKEVRLRRVRAELTASAPTATTVAAVAARWGFANPGRFAAEYRSLFGTTPGHDLSV